MHVPRIFFFVYFFISIITPNNVFAKDLSKLPVQEQAEQVLNGPEYISISVDNDAPSPFNTVKARVHSTMVDPKISDIVWMVNGIIASHSIGKDTFDFQVGALGKETVIIAMIRAPKNTLFVSEYRVIPKRIVMTFEAESYTPLFYKGRARYSPGNIVRVLVDAHLRKKGGEEYSNDELQYTWYRNYSEIKNQNGVAKNSIRIEGPKFLDNDLITVKIRSIDGKVGAEKSMIIKTENPQIILYENKSLLGATYFDALVSGDVIDGADLKIIAEPYYMSVKGRSNAQLKYIWNINNKKIIDIDNSAEPLFSIESLKEGSRIVITAKVGHIAEFLQEAKTKIELFIGESVLSNDLF